MDSPEANQIEDLSESQDNSPIKSTREQPSPTKTCVSENENPYHNEKDWEEDLKLPEYDDNSIEMRTGFIFVGTDFGNQ
eukprot:Awhi_evm1s4921